MNLLHIDIRLCMTYAPLMMRDVVGRCCSDVIKPDPLPEVAAEALVAGFKALADPTRLAVFRLIAAQPEPICVCEITSRFAVSQPTISHHLRVLREAGLITVSRRGVWAYYAVDPAGLLQLREALGVLAPDALVTVS